MTIEEGPDQEALFYIEGPDEDGCVWICSSESGEWCHNMGPVDKVTDVLCRWLASLDDKERSTRLTHDE